MKILMAWYPIQDVGGILNHNEELVAGLQDIGHEVNTLCFLPRDNFPRNGVAGGRGTISPHTGLEFDQRRGYSWPRHHCVPYRGKMLNPALCVLKTYDLVIWQVAVPTKRKENRGNMDWEELYTACPRNLAVIHDGNFLASYPWLSMVEEHLTGLICVHHCAFNSAKNIGVPSSFIPNPQEITNFHPDISQRNYEDRYSGFLSLQTFKAWKHVPELVAAMPHVGQGVLKYLGGKGIDYYYMTSKDKCKWPGIWDAAVDSGMEYVGVVTNEMRDETLKGLTCLVDPSWSKKYSAIGGHFNRVVIDALMCGTLPVVRPLGISTNLEGQGELFKAGVNCYAIPQGATPQQYGEALTEACTLPYQQWSALVGAGVEMLPMFERKVIAQQVVDMYNGSSQQRGTTSNAVKEDTKKSYYTFWRSQ